MQLGGNKLKSNKCKKKLYPVIFVGLCLFALILIFNWIQSRKEYIFVEKLSFSEVANSNFNLSSAEQENIKLALESRVREDDHYYGFAGNSLNNIDLYNLNMVVEFCKIMENYHYDEIKERFSFISNIDINSLDFLNIIYYVNICKELSINIDYTTVNNVLMKYYDESLELFFIDDTNDSINVKLIATAMCKKAMGEELYKEFFVPENGIRRTFDNYNFKTGTSVTFYNSGADIIYCYSVFNMVDELDFSKLNSWFEYWKNINESFVIDSFLDALQYSEYLNVATVFDASYSSEKLYEFYNGISPESISESDDLYTVFNILKNIRTLDDSEVNEIFKTELDGVINSNNMYDLKIDIKYTTFGVILANKIGFPINRNKLNNYISSNYKNINSIQNDYERINTLYYNLILDQALNGYDIEYDKELFQTQIDKTLRSMDYTTNIASDIVITRKLIELVMDLEIFDVDVTLTNAQASKIKDGVKKALSDDNNVYSSLLCDLFIINESMSFELLDNQRFLEVFHKLSVDGGNKSILSGDVQPDMWTTYQFISCLERLNNYDNIKQQKEFVDSIRVNEGIYKLDIKSYNVSDFPAILYGNYIKKLEVGGYKFD